MGREDTEYKTNVTLYVRIGTLETAKRVYGERGLSAAFERLILQEIGISYTCNMCECKFNENAWKKMPEKYGKCVSCGASFANLKES